MKATRGKGSAIRGVLALAAVLTGGEAVRAGPVTLSVPNVAAKAGPEVEVAITAKGGKGMRAPGPHTCVKCGRAITVPPEMAGKRFRCPACGTAQAADG